MAKRFRRRSSYKTKAKRKISKITGIPTTRSGRKAKVMRMATGGGCLLPVLGFIGIVISLICLII